jgi:hypothetical protein
VLGRIVPGTRQWISHEPHAISAETRDALAATAHEIEPWLDELFGA